MATQARQEKWKMQGISPLVAGSSPTGGINADYVRAITPLRTTL